MDRPSIAPNPIAQTRMFENTRQRVQELAVEIAELARRDLPTNEFYDGFLGRVAAAIGAVGGAVWHCQRADRFECAHTFGQAGDLAALGPEDAAAHHRLLANVAAGKKGLIAPSQAAQQNASSSTPNPTRWLLLCVPVVIAGETLAVIEILQRPEVTVATQAGNLRFIARMAEFANDFLKIRRLEQLSSRQRLWESLEIFTRQIHDSLDARTVAATIVEDGRRLAGCDRLSVLLPQGRLLRTEAISGQDAFDRRANTVRRLEQLAAAVALSGETLWYHGSQGQLAPKLEQAASGFLTETGAKLVVVVPLFKKLRNHTSAPSPPLGRTHARHPVGVLVAEFFHQQPRAEGVPEQTRSPTALRERIDEVAAHSAAALANAAEHQQVFLLPLWKLLGRARLVAGIRSAPKFIAWALGIAAVALTLSIAQADFDLKGQGTLEPVLRREVFAGLDGVVREIRVQHGQQVAEQQVLAVLRNDELELRRAAVTGERHKTEKTIEGLRAARTSQWTPEERGRHASRLRGLENTLESLEQQAELLERQSAHLEVKSPLAGEVVTWDIENLLAARPVGRGHALLTVADTSGEWRLEVPLPEDRLGHVAPAFRAARDRGEKLPVRFILATDPGTLYHGTVDQIADRSEDDPELGNTVLVTVRFDRGQFPPDHLRPGARATVHLHCGRRAVGYVWFHDVWEWVQREVLFRVL